MSAMARLKRSNRVMPYRPDVAQRSGPSGPPRRLIAGFG
jgi:hypothetical protein